MTVILNENTLTPDISLQSLCLYSYGVFTTFFVKDRKVKGLKYHVERLQTDSKVLFGIEPSEIDVKRNVNKFIDELGSPQQVVVRVTVFPVDFSLANPGNIENLNILVTGRAKSAVKDGYLKLMLVEAERSFPFQKTTNLIVNLKTRSIAQKRGYDDALIFSKGLITEGPLWNVFFIDKDTITTPPLRDNLLPGIARRLIIENANQYDIQVFEKSIPKDIYEKYESCFISNSAVGFSIVESIESTNYKVSSNIFDRIQRLVENIPYEEL